MQILKGALVAGPDQDEFFKGEFKLQRLRVVSLENIGRKIKFLKNCIAELIAYFFDIIPNLIFYTMEIKKF